MNLHRDTGLLVIDVQCGLFDEPHRVFDANGLVSRIRALTELAHSAGATVVYIQDDAGPGLWAPESEGWQIHPELLPDAAAVRIRKTYGDAFRDTALADELRARGVAELLITGCMTDFSVRATLQRALLRLLPVVLVADAHSTFDRDGVAAKREIDLLNEEVAHAARSLPIGLIEASAVTPS